jgi:hypothetical protein
MTSLADLKKIQALLTKVITTMEGDETPKEKKTKAPKEPKEAKEKSDKNLPRMTPTISKKLEEVIKEVTEWKPDFKKEFADVVNALTKDDFATKKLEEHIEDFALSKSPKANAGGGGSEAARAAPAPPAKAEVTVLTFKQLKELKGLKETDDPTVFSTKKGLVTGPEEIPEEEMEEGTFEGAEILIGETTRRVYNSEEEFMNGWWGIGKFKDADM